jgi:Cupredoxin-like domain
MRLSRGRCTADMRTTTTLLDDTARASPLGLGMSVPARQSVRGEQAASIAAQPRVEPQAVEVWVDRGYQPAQSVASADEPLRIVFHRRDADHCTERVVFSSPHIERRLAANGTTIVDLPAQPPGIVRFTCGMGRYHGEITLVEHRATLIPHTRLLRSLAAGAAVVALLAGLGTLRVEVAAGLGLLIAGATAVLLFTSRLTESRPSNQP